MGNLLLIKKHHYVYKTTNIINGKFYIGVHSTNNIDDKYLGSGKRLRRSISKYGKENFKREILVVFQNREEAVKHEKFLINEELLKNPNCLNINPGGNGGFTHQATKNGRKKTDEILKNKYGPNFRQIVSKNYFNNMSIDDKNEFINKIKKGFEKVNFNHSTFKGKKHTTESKNKISENKKGTGTGENNSQYGTMWITNGINNKKIKKEETLPFGWKKGRVKNYIAG